MKGNKGRLFQFPSNGKAHLNSHKSGGTTGKEMFQFPSNGKAHLNFKGELKWDSIQSQVSIPFKRESTFKRKIYSCNDLYLRRFQFPSNGKAHLNYRNPRPKGRQRRFQFPSNGKAHLNPRQNRCSESPIPRVPFQFPSNGKAHLNDLLTFLSLAIAMQVSIPFKRESTFKPFWTGSQSQSQLSFQFPSNGKAHLNPATPLPHLPRKKFQFPSNGKAHLNLWRVWYIRRRY